jgi:hypothetical protein
MRVPTGNQVTHEEPGVTQALSCWGEACFENPTVRVKLIPSRYAHVLPVCPRFAGMLTFDGMLRFD